MHESVQVAAFAEFLASRMQGRVLPGSTKLLPRSGESARVADAPSIFTIDGVTSADDCVLVVSNTLFPDFAGNAAVRSLTAKSLAGERIGKHVCAAIDHGYLDGVSFAVYPRLVNYAQWKVMHRLQVVQSRKAILEWLGQLQSRTSRMIDRGEDVETHFLAPMQSLLADEELDGRLRAAVAQCLQDVNDGRSRMALCLEHGDFWMGNVMLAPRLGGPGRLPRGRFQIIDWGGSRTDGYHATDAIRFALSTFKSRKHAAHVIRAYCEATGLAPREVPVHVFSALGMLLADLNEFPKERFNVLAARLFAFLDETGFLEGLSRKDAGRVADLVAPAAAGSRV